MVFIYGRSFNLHTKLCQCGNDIDVIFSNMNLNDIKCSVPKFDRGKSAIFHKPYVFNVNINPNVLTYIPNGEFLIASVL